LLHQLDAILGRIDVRRSTTIDSFTRCGAAPYRPGNRPPTLLPALYPLGKGENDMSQQGAMARGWSIEGFRSFWAKPDLSLIPRIHEISTNNIVGYWPRPIGVVRDSEAYVAVIDAIARVCPDLSLTAPEYARSGELHFVRWVATGTGCDGPFEFNGLDRLRVLPDGRVCENYIFCDHPFFAEVAEYLRQRARLRVG
jgi:hypothetical protein